MRAGVPVVFADRPPGRIAADTVLSDNVGGSRKATAHLIAGGHRRIGYLGDSPDIFTARERHNGYLEAMTGAGVPVAEAWIAMGPPTKGRVRADLERMLAGPGRLPRWSAETTAYRCWRCMRSRRWTSRWPWSASTTSNSPTSCA